MNEKPFFVLSVDGGGIHGFLFLKILSYIERKTQRSISELFSVIAGVSTGGIIALGLSIPNSSFQAAYSCDDLLVLYRYHAKNIFHSTFLGKMAKKCGPINALHHVLFPKYDSFWALDFFQRMFGSVPFSSSLVPLVIPAYNISDTHPGPHLKLFLSGDCSGAEDYPMADVAMSTCAAPTYFSPFAPRFWKGENAPLRDSPYRLIDGGVAINDPSIFAYLEAKKNYYKGPIKIVSLGFGPSLCAYRPVLKSLRGGLWAWRRHLAGLLTEPSVSAYQRILSHLMGSCGAKPPYWRLQMTADSPFSFDNCSVEHFLWMEKKAENFLEERKNTLDSLCCELMQALC